MITGRRASDWLTCDARPAGGDERRGADRRSGDRRAPRRSIDTLFAMTLINQVRPATETLARLPYAAAAAPRAGALRNLRA